MLWVILVAVTLICAFSIVALAVTANDGWEDADGFHYGHKEEDSHDVV